MDIPVVVVEGEKARDALRDAFEECSIRNVDVVGTVTGAGDTPGERSLDVLKGREVILWPDNDEPGRGHMTRVGDALAGVAVSVRWFDPANSTNGTNSDFQKGYDAADHGAVKDGDPDALDRLLQDLLEAPTFQPTNSTNSNPKELPDAEAFPLAVLPRPVKRLVEEASASILCPPDYVALPALVCLGAAIGNSRTIELKHGWSEGAAIYGAVVGVPGDKKSPSAAEGLRPAGAEEKVLRREYREAKARYEEDARRYERDKREARKEGRIDPAPPTKPVPERVVVDDTTVEALSALLSENKRGLMVHKDELSGFFEAFNQYKPGGKGSDRQFYLSAWSNRRVSVDRKGQDEPVLLERPFVALCGTIQPDILPGLGSGRGDDGFTDRFLFAYPEPVPGGWSDAEISEEAKHGYRGLYRGLRALEMDLDEYGDPEPKPVRFSPDARAVFKECVNEHNQEKETPGFPAKLRGAWAKLEGYFARLTLILALCRCVAESVPESIESRDVVGAWALLAYFKNQARRVYALLYGHDPEEEVLEEVCALVKVKGGNLKVPVKELHETLASPGKPQRSAELTKFLKRLASKTARLSVRDGEWVGSARALTLTLRNAVGAVGAVEGSAA